MKSLFVFIVFLVSVSGSFPQNNYSLELISGQDNPIIKKINYKKKFASAVERERELQKTLFYLYDNAFLAASYDSVIRDSLSLKAYIHTGEQYKWASLKRGNVDEGILSEIRFREDVFRGRPLYYKDVLQLQERLLMHAENNGYPFASVKLDSIEISGSSISAVLHLEKNKQIKLDSILVRGNARVSPVYLYNYLSVKPNDPYNEQLVEKIDSRIKELAFVKLSAPSEVLFTEKATRLILYLDKRNASRFDGYLGILPNDQSAKVIVTGDLRLKLQNTIGKGELIDVNWRSLQKNTQDMKAMLSYPFLFSTPFGADYNFKLYKKDTLFLEVSQNPGIQYLLTGGSYFKVFIHNRKSSLLSTKGLEFQTTLPVYADINATVYGIGFRREKLDYRFNPKKGYFLNVNVGAGSKSIKKNSRLNPAAYNNVVLNSAQYNSDLEAVLFFPAAKRSVIKTGVQSAWLYSPSIFQNELFRIGGLKSMRGIDEESVFASFYSVFTLEFRYLLEQNSYLYLFTDGAYYENMSVGFTGNDRDDTPVSFGAGVSFGTRAGIFSINYALGKQFNNPIYLKAGKVHFGVVSYF